MTDEPWVPCLPPPMPARARQHCRHYHCEPGGPRCAVGIDLSGPGAAIWCLPQPTNSALACDMRREWTAEERATWQAWSEEHMKRTVVVMMAIPSDGYEGALDPCPGCGVGKVRWYRVRSNKHLHAQCSTPHCFAVMQ